MHLQSLDTLVNYLGKYYYIVYGCSISVLLVSMQACTMVGSWVRHWKPVVHTFQLAIHLASSSSSLLSLQVTDTLHMIKLLHTSQQEQQLYRSTTQIPSNHTSIPSLPTPSSSTEQFANLSGSSRRPTATFVCTSEGLLHVCTSVRATQQLRSRT